MYKIIDLFAGIGGIRRGFELVGQFKNVLSAEIDQYACETYKHLFGQNPYNDVTSEEFKLKVQSTDYDILLAGFPCQSFSRAGKQEGFFDKTRGTLFFDVADIINRTHPKGFLLENVDNLVSHEKGRTFKIILETLIKDLNYKIVGVEQDREGNLIYEKNNFIRNSKKFGVPQNRPRTYIMGFNRRLYGGLVDELPIKELPKIRSGNPIYADLNELIELRSSEIECYLSEGYLNTLIKHRDRHEQKGNGFGYMVVNDVGIEKPLANAILATGGSGKERNLIYDPQDGVVGMVVKYKKSPLNSKCIRTMTPREWGKLQGFTNYAFMVNGVDEFSFPSHISKAQQYKQLGNSVTIPVIEEIAKGMEFCLKFLDKKTIIDQNDYKSNEKINKNEFAAVTSA